MKKNTRTVQRFFQPPEKNVNTVAASCSAVFFRPELELVPREMQYVKYYLNVENRSGTQKYNNM